MVWPMDRAGGVALAVAVVAASGAFGGRGVLATTAAVTAIVLATTGNNVRRRRRTRSHRTPVGLGQHHVLENVREERRFTAVGLPR